MTAGDDIFGNWKQLRFVTVPIDLYDPKVIGENLVILSDASYWSEHYDELIKWCSDNGGEVNGMCVSFSTQHQLTMFILRWS